MRRLCAVLAIVLSALAGVACSSSHGRTATSSPSSSSIPAQVCPPSGAVVVALGGAHLAGNSAAVLARLHVGQTAWVVYRPRPLIGSPAPTGSLAAGVTYPTATQPALLRITCRSASASYIGAAFTAQAVGRTDVVVETRCARGCNELAFTAMVVIEGPPTASPSTTVGAHGANPMAKGVSCRMQNTHPAYYPPTGFIPGPTIPKASLQAAASAADANLWLFAEAFPKSNYADQLAVLAPAGWACIGSLYEDGAGTFDIYPPTAAPQFVWTKTANPDGSTYRGPLVSLATNWLGHGTTGPMMCPWLTDRAFVQQARRIDPNVSCRPTPGAEVTHITSDISRITLPDGTLGAAASIGVNSTNGTTTILRCRALALSTCRTVVDNYLARIDA